MPELLRLMRREWRSEIWGISFCPEDLPTATGEEDAWRAAVRSIVGAYADRVGRPSGDLWIDHTPHNIRYAQTLLEEFPDARFIHIVRDGRAVASSVLPLPWGPNTIPFAARWWLRKIASGLAVEVHMGPDRVRRVRYEQLVSQPETVLREMCEFLGIPFESSMVEGGGYRVPSYTESQHALVASPPDPSRISAWRSKLTEREIECFEFYTDDILGMLGYSPEFGFLARRPSKGLKLKWRVQERLRSRLVNPARSALRRHTAGG